MPYLDLHVHISDVTDVGRVLSDCFDNDEEYGRYITRQDDLKTKSSSLCGNVLHRYFETVVRYMMQNEIPYWACIYDTDKDAEGDINRGWINADTLKYHNGYWCASVAEIPIRDLYEATKNPQTLGDFIKEKTFRYEMPDFENQKRLRAEAKTTSLLLNHL